MKKLLIATRNKGKLREIKFILSNIPLDIVDLDDVKFEGDVEETGKTFTENAIIKATTVGKKTGFFTLADDSGLEIDALGGKPGVRSARYIEGNDMDRVHQVLDELKDVPEERRTARFIAIVAVYNPMEGKTYTFEGESKGRITDKPIGKNGFGYDPIFYNFDLGKTNGEATPEEKNKISHRARALEKAKIYLARLTTATNNQ